MNKGTKKVIKTVMKLILGVVALLTSIALLLGGTDFYEFVYKGLTAPRPLKPKIRYSDCRPQHAGCICR